MYHSVKQFVVNHPWERLILSITYLNYRIIFPCNIFLFWILYSILVWVYAGIIFALNDLGDDSIYNAFELSWTTMSTVGYGTVAVSVESSHMFSRIVLAIEALVGILYVGLSGAMIITKVSRRLATAHVNFSTMICVKYGDDKAKVTCVVTTKSSFSDQPGSGLKHREAKLENNCLPNLAQGAWHVRHRLLNGSPLLKKEYRENGDWPTGYNYGKGIEGALSFESINVIFTGKSNLTAKTCFKTFQYKVTDVKYGVRFKYLGYVRSDDPSNEEYFIINFEEWNSTESQNNP